MDLNGRFKSQLHRCFVLYNPLYFFSALCFIFGVFLVSRGLTRIPQVQRHLFMDGQVLLTGVIELYEILLLAGSFILYRKTGQRRPAVILGLIEVVLIFDLTFQTEHLSFAAYGPLWTFLWIAVFALKLKALTWIFRLKASPRFFSIPVLAALGVGIAPYIVKANIGSPDTALTAHYLLTWYGAALAFAVLWFPTAVADEDDLDDWGKTVLDRSVKAAWLIWAGAYLYHLFGSWLPVLDIRVNIAHLSPFLVILSFVPGLSEREESTWMSLAIAMAVSLTRPQLFWITALFSGTTFLLKGWEQHRYRLYVGAVIAFYLALSTLGWHRYPFPQPGMGLSVLAVSALVVVGFYFRLIAALVPLCLGILVLWIWNGPHSQIEWGIMLIFVGFVSLIAGVFINWKQGAA